MPTVKEPFLWNLLQAVAAAEPNPLYPARFARAANVDRDMLDDGLDELRRRGLVELTEWVKDFGQGCALTETGRRAVAVQNLPSKPVAASVHEAGDTGGISAIERGEIVRGAFLAPCPPYVSRFLIAANILFFLAGAVDIWSKDLPVGEYLAGQSRATEIALIDMGALSVNQVFQHDPPQFWRIVLFFFLHIGVLHIFMNMYFLGTLGPLIEAMWGSPRFLAIYFISGLVSGCVVLLIIRWQGQDSLTAGASGALFGIFASFLVWFLFNQKYLPRDFVRAWSRNIAVNLVLLTAINFFAGVSWQGHLGGAIGGFLAALVLHVQRFSPHLPVRILAVVAAAAIPAAFFGAVLWEVGKF